MDAAAMEVARLVLRQDAGSEADAKPACAGSNDYDGRMGVRISSIFVILVGSLWGKSLLFALHHVLCWLLLGMYITSSTLQLHLSPLFYLTTTILCTSH
jgi:hypothetical protein